MVLSRLFLVGLAAVLAVSESAWEPTFMDALLFTTGCVLVPIGMVGRIWCTLYIAGYKTKTLVTEGPYSICRNPLYFFSFIGGLGVALTTETLVVPAVVAAAFAAYYPLIVRKEEERLAEVHGAEFAAYRQAVPAFIPDLRLLREAETYPVNAVVFRRHISDALWFFWFVALIELVEKFHELDILPVHFHLR